MRDKNKVVGNALVHTLALSRLHLKPRSDAKEGLALDVITDFVQDLGGKGGKLDLTSHTQGEGSGGCSYRMPAQGRTSE